MGKISSGCDIVFIVNGNLEDAIRMGSTLSYELSSYKAIAETLMRDILTRLKLKDRLKYETSTREVTREDLEQEGIVANNSVKTLASKYSQFDWSGVDQSTKIISADWFRYYGADMSNSIILQRHPRTGVREKLIVVDPSNIREVANLHRYLTLQSKIDEYSDETRTLMESSDLDAIFNQLPALIEVYKASAQQFEELTKKAEEGELSKAEQKKLDKLASSNSNYLKFKEFTPANPTELLKDFLDNKSKYAGLAYTLNGVTQSVQTELDNLLKALEGKNVKEASYQDVFANEVASNAKYNSARGLFQIRLADFKNALKVKLADLQFRREKMTDKNSQQYKDNLELSKVIDRFLKLESPKPKQWQEIIQLLIDLTDDEFSYTLDGFENGWIFLKNVPLTLEQRYEDFSYKALSVMKPVDSYKGFTIYYSPDGKYYFDRHVLTTRSYGKKYKSIQECRALINQRVRNNPISLQSLVEIKTRGERDVVWMPNKFLPGQVIKSLNIPLKANQQLNEYELSLIYDSGLRGSNNLDKFYEYVSGIVAGNSSEYIKGELHKYIDTAEKAATFIYLLNALNGTDRALKISIADFSSIVDTIKNAGYEYFVVEEVGDAISVNGGYKQYIDTKRDGDKKVVQSAKRVHRTLLTPIQSAEILNSLVQVDEKVLRPVPSVRLLNDLKDKISAKLGIDIHVETQSTLEELFDQWGIEMPAATKAFVKDGNIYINSSLATDEDFMHEYTHLLLGVLKARNYDNYSDLVQIVANTTRGERIKARKRKDYPNIADSDLNEEVFADLFAEYMSGRDLGAFLNGTLKDARQAVDDKMGSIFGKQRITEEFYNASLNDIFRLFGYDLGQIMNEGNGLELSSGTVFRQASNWIEQQIAKYKDDEDGNVGIYENCE